MTMRLMMRFVGVLAGGWLMACGGGGEAGGTTDIPVGMDVWSGDTAPGLDVVIGPDGAGPDNAVQDVMSPSDDLLETVQPDTSPFDDLPMGPDVTPDATPVEGNLIRNHSFEDWSDGAPDFWQGEVDQMPDGTVMIGSTGAHSGNRTVRLDNAATTHKRFSTQPTAAIRGRWDCTYQVRGHGRIRNGHFHGLEGNGFSSYEPSGFVNIDDAEWQEVAYSFTLPADAPMFELIFSVAETVAADGDLELDDVICLRQASPCDDLICPDWATCNEPTVTCEPRPGFCGDGDDCFGWEACDENHVCQVLAGRCNIKADCLGLATTPVCDMATHTCIAGDPCADVNCPEWRPCSPASATCELLPDRCDTTADCKGTLPACDRATHACQPAEHACNVLIGGGFETWVEDAWGHSIPEGWFGMDTPGATEIDPNDVTAWTVAPHSGTKAARLVQEGIANRLTTEAVDLETGTYTCAYWVRGHGSIRHRYYSTAGWSVEFAQDAVDSDTWVHKTFPVEGNVRDFRFIFYASFTQADRDHVQIDDVVCTRN